MKKVEKLAKEILGNVEKNDLNNVDGLKADDTSFDPPKSSSKNCDDRINIVPNDEDENKTKPKKIVEVESKSKKKKKKKKTELERLKIESKEFNDPPKPRRCKKEVDVLNSPMEWKNRTMATVIKISNSTESSETRNLSSFLSSEHATAVMKTPMYSVTKNNSEQIMWPAMVMNMKDVGGVTAALAANVTGWVAEGRQVDRVSWGEGADIIQGSNSDCIHDVFLI